MSADAVEVDRSDEIATVRFNRPDSLNAVSIDLQREFRDVLADLSADPARGLVITGAGDVTCAGMDRDLVSDPDYHKKYADEIDDLNDQIEDYLTEYPYPSVVAAKGALVGVGFVFSLHCDLLVMGEETHFSLPEISYGISTAELVPKIAKHTGERAAMEIALRGEAIPPEHANELGLVNEVVPEGDVEDTATEILEEIAEFDPEVVRDVTGAL